MSSVQKPKYTMEDYVYVNGKMVPKSKLTYTDGGQATNTGVYPTSVDVGSFTPPPVSPTPTVDNSRYTYVPGSAAPTNANAMDYATWLQGNTKYQAGQMREQAVKQAETDRQRAIVDANSAYAKNQALYGANAENMASMGLSSSGYGEYLTGKAYATQRADVQNANATAQARKDQALYEEGRLKMQADQKYAEDLINIDNARNESYNSLYNSALNGASIESLMQDGRWSNLTVAQQNTIKQATTANSIKTMIDGGATLESLASNEGWLSLTNDQRNQLTVYANNLADAKATEAEGNFSTWLNGISSGAYTLDDVKAMSGYENLSPDQKERLESAYDSEINVMVSSLSEEYKADWNNLNDVKKTLSVLGYSANIITDFVSSWQQANYDLLVSELQNTWSSQNVDPIKELESDIDNGLLSEDSGKKLLNAMKTVLETPVIVGGSVETRPNVIKIYYQLYPEEWKTAVLTILEGGRLPGDTSSDLPKLGGPASGNYKNAYQGDVDKLIEETRNKSK